WRRWPAPNRAPPGAPAARRCRAARRGGRRCRCGRRDRWRWYPGRIGGWSDRRKEERPGGPPAHPPIRPSADPPSLPLPREVEAHEQDVRHPTVGESAQRHVAADLFDRPLRLEIEGEIAGAAHELDIGDRAVAMHHERHFGLEW